MTPTLPIFTIKGNLGYIKVYNEPNEYADNDWLKF